MALSKSAHALILGQTYEISRGTKHWTACTLRLVMSSLVVHVSAAKFCNINIAALMVTCILNTEFKNKIASVTGDTEEETKYCRRERSPTVIIGPKTFLALF